MARQPYPRVNLTRSPPRPRARPARCTADELDSGETTSDDGEDDSWKRAKPTSSASNLRRSARARPTKSYRDDGEDAEEEQQNESGGDDADTSDSEERRGPKQRRGRKRRKTRGGAAGGEDADVYGAETADAPNSLMAQIEDSMAPSAYKLDKIVGVRYADLDISGMRGYAAAQKLASEDARLRAEEQLQLDKRRSMPLSDRRAWDTLEYLVKWKALSYLHVEWVTPSLIREQGHWGIIRAKRFLELPEATQQLDEEELRIAEGREPPPPESFFDEDVVAIERILSEREVDVDAQPVAVEGAEAAAAVPGKRTMYLVKWRGLPYGECTWEWAEEVRDDTKVALFRRFNQLPRPEDVAARYDSATGRDVRPDPKQWAPYKETPAFRGGRTLRDYQLEGLNWMIFNWHHHRNCILADEMGLGKTVQSVTVLEHLRTRANVRGPFLVLAPLSTLGHWKREFEEWTDMNAVYYHDQAGGAEAR
jgi:chromodomain-helicase-DNA-binding protein 7